MDRCSHYKWELTADELDTIWWAVVERAEKMYAEAEKTTDPEMKQLMKNRARKARDIQGQINRMRTRYW